MYKYNLKDFCNIISALRKSKFMTQSTLAEKIGVTPQSVSKWECGIGYPDVTLFPIIAEVLQVPIGVLFGENEYISEYDKENLQCIKFEKCENIKVFIGNVCRVEFVENEFEMSRIEINGDKIFVHYFDVEQDENTLIVNVKNPSSSEEFWKEYDRQGYEGENIVRIYTGNATDSTGIECVNYLDLDVSNMTNANGNYEVVSEKM